MGYDGLYKQKTRESMGQYGKVDGCAIFWKRSKFIMVENYPLEFNEIVLRNAHQLGLDEGDKHRYFYFIFYFIFSFIFFIKFIFLLILLSLFIDILAD